ncbi:tyrosine-type recombinase/integrase [Streptomyces sp. NPDC058746]|uniref:tyrosine-type recombinase/integrase n=1 Tax=Streptomyces sp. NPDC058746 TaxID=3346622 RepID=UPI00368C668B
MRGGCLDEVGKLLPHCLGLKEQSGGRPWLDRRPAQPKAANLGPGVIVQEIRDHLEKYAEPGADGRVFVGAKGATPRRNHFNLLWHKACRKAGIKGLHFHDLRHTGNTLAASTGASTRELMARMGHSTARAALIYQHASADRDRLIADALSGLVQKGRRGTGERKGHAGDTEG